MDKLQRIDALKNKIDKFRPLNPPLRKQLREYFRIGFTYTSNALEGNSLTEIETKIVIEDGITIGGKSLRDHYEAIGHSEAYDLLFTMAKRKEITEAQIKELHRVFYYRIDPKQAGKYRKQKVFISGSAFIPPSPKIIPIKMKELIVRLPDLRARLHPVEYAAVLHRELATIHPFIDGNGRTARLLMNLALLQSGYPIAVIPPILRRKYIEALEKSHRQDDRPFLDLIISVCYESAKDYLRLLAG